MTEAQMIGQIAKLKARLARVEYQRDWFENEAKINADWGNRGWDQVRRLSDMLEKAIAHNGPQHIIVNRGTQDAETKEKYGYNPFRGSQSDGDDARSRT